MAGKMSAKSLPLVGTDQAGVTVQDLLEQRRAGTGKTRQHRDLLTRPGFARLDPALEMSRRERVRQLLQMPREVLGFLPHWPFVRQEEIFAPEHGLHGTLVVLLAVRLRGQFGPGLGA